MTCQQRVDKLNEKIGEKNLNGKWIAMNPGNKWTSRCNQFMFSMYFWWIN